MFQKGDARLVRDNGTQLETTQVAKQSILFFGYMFSLRLARHFEILYRLLPRLSLTIVW
jgi:hypothetical protein